MTVHRVHHLNCGTMHPPVPAALGQPGWRGRGEMVCHCLVIETARDGLVLVDSGFSTLDAARPERLPAAFRGLTALRVDPAEAAVRQIAALGYDPRDVRHVVVTHLDLDHAGGLADFPAATVHVHAREHRAAMTRGAAIERWRYLPVQWAHGPRWQLHAERGDTWRGLPAVARLPGLDADIGLVALAGHSRGHSGVVVRTSDRWLLHAGDAYFHPRGLAPGGRAPWGYRLFEAITRVDRAAHAASVAALRRLRDAPDVEMFCAHEPGELAAARASAAARAAQSSTKTVAT